MTQSRARTPRLTSWCPIAVLAVALVTSCGTKATRPTSTAADTLNVAVLLLPEFDDRVFSANDWRSDVQTSASLVEVKVGRLADALLESRIPELFPNVQFIRSDAPLDALTIVPTISHMDAHRSERQINGEVVASVELDFELRSGDTELLSLSSSSSGSYNPRQEESPLTGLIRIPVLLVDIALVIPEQLLGAHGPAADNAIFVRKEYSNAFSVALSKALDQLLTDLHSSPRMPPALGCHRALVAGSATATGLDRVVSTLLDRRQAGVIAVMDLSTTEGKVGPEQERIAAELRARIDKHGSLVSVDRELLDQVLAELRLRPSDLADPHNLREFGRLTSADAVVIGKTTDIGPCLVVDAQLLDAEDGTRISASKVTLVKGTELSN